MKLTKIIWFALGIVLILISVWQIAAAQNGLRVVSLHSNPPVTLIMPDGIAGASRPTVLIGHGFAGSAAIMRGFALTLAHAGFITVSWDFAGHGANPEPFPSTANGLVKNAEAALAAAAANGWVDTQRVAILGDSMGSGVALEYAVDHPDTMATIAVSPVPEPVNPSLPHNLLVMAGALEPRFVSNAEQVLAQAGGEHGSLADGTARQLAVVPNVEHISILFSPTAHRTALDWLDGTFGVQPGAVTYTDRRIVWFALGIAGFIMLSAASLAAINAGQVRQNPAKPAWLRLAALAGGGLGATLILWLVSLAGVDVSRLLGLLVGGYIIAWFGLAGVISLLILRPHIPRPQRRELLMGLTGLAALWLGVGLLGQFVWMHWLLIPARLVLWIPAAITVFPFFLAVGEAARSANLLGQAGWWLAQALVVCGGLYLALSLNPALGFIFIILPIFPVIIGFLALAVSPKHGAWAYSLAGALFTGWLLLTTFPKM